MSNYESFDSNYYLHLFDLFNGKIIMKNKIEWLDRALIKGPYFCLCTNEKQFVKTLKDLNYSKPMQFILNEHSHATAHHFDKADGGTTTIVCIKIDKKRKKSEIYGLLIHEAVHIWQNYCERIGEKNPSIEFEAYSIQWIAQQLIEQYIKQA